MIEYLIQLLTKPQIEWSLFDKAIGVLLLLILTFLIIYIWAIIEDLSKKLRERRKDKWKK